jgi:hypothetical protein
MGLDTSHDCWHGPYSSFGEFRSALFDAAVGGGSRVKYAYMDEIDALDSTDPLREFLVHSDCDGELPVSILFPLASRLEELAPRLNRWHREAAERFAAGLRAADALGEAVEFH